MHGMRMSMSRSSRTTETREHDGGERRQSVWPVNASLRAGRMRYRVCSRDCGQ